MIFNRTFTALLLPAFLFVGILLSGSSRKMDVLYKNHHDPCRSIKDDIHYQAVMRAEKKDDVITNYWISYPLIRDSLNGFGGTYSGFFLFPDSTVFVEDSTGVSRVKHHAAGQVLDRQSSVFVDYYELYSCGTDFDSIGVQYMYGRNYPDMNLVDTLEIRYYSSAGLGNLDNDTLTGTAAAPFGVANLIYKKMKYDYVDNLSVSTGLLRVVKIPLTKNDTAVSSFRVKVALAFPFSGFDFDATDKAGVCIRFLPAYPYSQNDTITRSGNWFKLASLEENGLNTYPDYYPGEYNCSYVVPSSVRYNSDPTWNGKFIPCFAMDSSFKWEHHVVYYYTASLCVNTPDPFSPGGFHLELIYPNPTSDIANVRFTTGSTSNVDLILINVIGQTVMRKSFHQLPEGEYIEPFNVSGLSSGRYYLAMESGEFKEIQALEIAQ